MVIGSITPRESVADFRKVFRHEIVRRLRRDRNSFDMEVAIRYWREPGLRCTLAG